MRVDVGALRQLVSAYEIAPSPLVAALVLSRAAPVLGLAVKTAPRVVVRYVAMLVMQPAND